MQVRGEVHNQGSWSSGSLMLSREPMLPLSRCCGWWCGHVQLSHSSHFPSSLLACVCLFSSSMFSWSLQCIPYGSPYREPGRPLPSSLQAPSASFSHASASVHSGAWRQPLPQGVHTSSRSSHWGPAHKGCGVSSVALLLLVAVHIFIVFGACLGSSSPASLGSYSL